MPSVVINAAIATVIFAPSISAAAQPQVVRWSGNSYGPDGPWGAVTVEIGTPAKSVDLLPGGSWMTNILSVHICKNSIGCPAEKAGLYDFLESSSFTQIGATGDLKDNFDENPGSLSAITEGAAGFTVPITMKDFSMLVFESAQSTLPDGSKYPPTIGKLALGSPHKNQTWKDKTFGQFNGTLLTSAIFEQGRSPSNSYSMHVGSPSLKIPGSLVLGGYHKDRVLGSVSVQPYAFDTLPIDLLDISIGVAVGASPFNFTTKTGLLAEGDPTFEGGQQVTVDGTQPYLYLPSTACVAITKSLPVQLDSRTGLYFWDTSSPSFEKIVKSSAFLEFTFRESASVTSNMTVKVPFSLLDLQLTSPIISKPRRYFPCFGGQDPTRRWSLGRAFMQAAFVGVKWEDGGGNWFLSQAPGPNTPRTISPLELNDTIVSSTTKWEETWKTVWAVNDSTEDDSTSTNTTTEGTGSTATLGSPTATGMLGADGSDGKDGSSGPPVGAIAGAAVGGVLLFGVAIVAFIFYRRRKAKQAPLTELFRSEDKNSDYYARDEFKAELCATEREIAEMEGKSYQGRFGQAEGEGWKGTGYAHHGQGLGLGLGRGGRVSVHEMGTQRSPVEMYAP